MVEQSEKGLAVACSEFQVLGTDFPHQANQAFYPYGIDELVPVLSEKVSALTVHQLATANHFTANYAFKSAVMFFAC